MTQSLLSRLGLTNPIKILNEKSGTFALASSFLSESDVQKLSSLYAVCRKIDDLADDAENHSEPANTLHELKNYLCKQQSSKQKVLLYSGTKLNPEPLIDLIEGVQFDLNPVRISTLEELLEYCYKVAGTVGLMITKLYSLPASAESHAVSLGVGMQLTNIARDVHEDFKMNRIYVPDSWMNHRKFAEAINSGSNSEQLYSCRRQLLTTAEKFYRYADSGWTYLPWSIRPALYFAAVCYRSIGSPIMKKRTYPNTKKPSLSILTVATTLCYAIYDFLVRTAGSESQDSELPQKQIKSARNGTKIGGSELT